MSTLELGLLVLWVGQPWTSHSQSKQYMLAQTLGQRPLSSQIANTVKAALSHGSRRHAICSNQELCTLSLTGTLLRTIEARCVEDRSCSTLRVAAHMAACLLADCEYFDGSNASKCTCCFRLHARYGSHLCVRPSRDCCDRTSLIYT